MRLINPNDMVRALQGGAVRRWEYKLYGAIWLIGCTLSFWMWYVTDYAHPWLRYLDLMTIVAVLVGGTFLSWHINKKGDGNHF